MPIVIKDGDLLKSDCEYICHQVNCKGKMNSGIAKSIREMWPSAYEAYFDKWRANYEADLPSAFLLGDIQICTFHDEERINNIKGVINMFGQDNYGYDGLRYTSYDAIWSCLSQISKLFVPGTTIGFPYHVGCDRGGGNWDLIYWMIEYLLGDKYNIEIWRLPKDEN